MSKSEAREKQSILIDLLIADYEENKEIELVRESQLIKEANSINSLQCQLQMKNITEKLNRLEKTILKKNQLNEKSNQIVNSNHHKYEQLNSLNQKLRKALGKLTSNKDLRTMQEIQKKVIGLYRQTVVTLNNQDRLCKKICYLKQQNQTIDKQTIAAAASIQHAQLQLSNVKALKQLSLGRLTRLKKSL